MARLRGSRRSWMASLRAMASSRCQLRRTGQPSTAPPSRRTSDTKTSSSDGRHGGDPVAGAAVRREEARQRGARGGFVLHHHVHGAAEHRRLDDAGRVLQLLHRGRPVVGGELENRFGHPAAKRGRPIEGDEPAAVHQRQPVAVLRLFHVVRADEDRRAAVGEGVDQFPEAAARHRVHARRGLVEKEDGRLVQHGAAERQALLPSERKLRRHLAPVFGESGHAQHPVATRFEPGSGDVVEAGEEGDVLVDGEIAVQREELRHVADALLDALGVGATRRSRPRAPCPTSGRAGR